MVQTRGKQVTVVLISFVLYVPVAVLASYYLGLFESNRRYGRLFKQALMYQCIERAGQVPNKITDLAQNDGKDRSIQNYLKYIDHYNPNAWQNPQDVLFMHKHIGFFYVTFGDGSQAILRYWKSPGLEGADDDRPIKYLYAPPQWSEHWIRILLFGAIAILISSLTRKRLLDRGKVAPTEMN